MALALADSMAHGWNLDDQMRRYGAWFQKGEYSANGRALTSASPRPAPRSASKRACPRWSAAIGMSFPKATAASCAWRRSRYTARPVPNNLEELARRAAESSRVTHVTETCCAACRYLALLLGGLIHGVPKDEVLAPDGDLLRRLQEITPLPPPIAESAAGSFRRKQPPEIQGTGHVVKSLEAALWAFSGAGGFPASRSPGGQPGLRR